MGEIKTWLGFDDLTVNDLRKHVLIFPSVNGVDNATMFCFKLVLCLKYVLR